MRAAMLASLVLVIPLVAVATGDAFVEDWSDVGGWTFGGDGAAQACGSSGCVLRLDPPCCAAYASAVADVELPIGGMTVLAAVVRGPGEFTNTDVDVEFRVGADAYTFTWTDWPENSGVTLIGPSGRTTVPVPQSMTEYRVAVVFDAARGVAHVQATSLDGSVLGASPAMDFSGATFEGLRITAVSWAGWAAGWFEVDDLCVGPAVDCGVDVAAPGLIVSFEADPWYGPGPRDVVFTASAWPGDPDRSIMGWTVAWGDGTTEGGAGAPPPSMVHWFDVGEFRSVLTVERDDGVAQSAEAYVFLHASDLEAPLVAMRVASAARSHPVDAPFAEDGATIAVTTRDDHSLAVDIQFCWSTSAGGAGCEARTSVPSIEEEFDIPPACAGTEVVYSATATDAAGNVARAESSYVVEGDPTLDALFCGDEALLGAVA